MSEPRSGRAGNGVVSRADALRAWLALGPGGVAGPARSLGFTWVEPRAPTETPVHEVETAPTGTAAPAEAGPVPEPAAPLAPLAFWRPVAVDRPEITAAAEPEPDSEPRQPMTAGDLRASAAPPAPPPIVAEPRLRRRLDAELRNPRPGHGIDVETLVHRLARGESIREVPRRLALAQARLVLVLDPSPRLKPFWEDQLDLALALIHRLGAGRVRRLPAPGAGHGGGPPDVAGDEIVLAVSDLGFYGGPQDRERWVRFGRRLRAEGARLRALVPCPAWRWRGPGARLWHAVDWSAPEGSGRRRRPRPLAGAPVADPVEALLRLLAPAVRVEPGLLRCVRRLLGESADLGTEVDVWNHADVDGGSSRTLEIDPRSRLARTGEPFGPGWDADLVAEVARAIVGWHRQRAGLVWASEVAHLRVCGVPDAELGTELLAEAERVFARAAAGAASADPADRRIAEGVRAFWRRESDRAPVRLATDRRFGPALVRAVRALRDADPEAALPAGVTPGMIVDLDSDLPLRRYGVWQAADRLRVRPAGAEERGSLLVEISARQPLLMVSDGLQAPLELDLGEDLVELPCPAPSALLELVTDVEAVELEAWVLPPWASAAGRDGYGLWAAFEVEGVEQRLRWIPPGRFMMGSPEDEEGRWDGEGPRHEVTLTEGFWLGEMPCTQALWEAVMGENPSRFQSPQRPVEQVSWGICQQFLDRLNFRVRDLELELPTEAEWEFACRAGTETATWKGDLEILGANNAPVLDDIAWYGGNSGVGYDLEEREDTSEWPEKQYPHTWTGTRQGGQKAANPWGLRDVLGNVWEWCWDWFGSYEDEAAVDPEGPEDGTGRVLRGGSWGSYARCVRAAYRLAHVPGERGGNLGFRLSRGPWARGAKLAEQSSAASERVGRGTSPRRRSRRSRSRAWVDRLGWALDGGLDEYGRWAAFEVEGVVQRLRWIYPGRFMMGSPEDEKGRFDDEGPQHEVTLTEGFWLGEVPCTQALWEAVMGENPSRFQSPQRPVETVSWEACQKFLERLEAQVPGFSGRLPTEAEWEYACRAGTEQATWAGDLEIRGENDALRLDVIAWYGGNSGVDFDLEAGVDSAGWPKKQHPHTRAGTRVVGLKRPNPWGLYDMLGNVYEWCSDRWDYTSGYPGYRRVDPEGVDGALRVFRGGSWRSDARYVRAAYRYALVPGERYVDLGFRLSRGPDPGP